MNGKNIDLYELILSAWTNTLKKRPEARGTSEGSRGRVNHEASAVWLDCLGKKFQEYYDNNDQRVFWKGNKGNRGQFGLNELLFDLSVCQVEEVPSIRKGTLLPFVTNCHWQVESELNDSNSREITKDFSKLVMGQSDNKLFISSYQGDNQMEVRKMCSPVAHRCTGKLHLCFVDHPRNWGGKPELPVLLRWKDNGWRPCAKGTD